MSPMTLIALHLFNGVRRSLYAWMALMCHCLRTTCPMLSDDLSLSFQLIPM